MKSVLDDIHYYLFGIFTGLILAAIGYLSLRGIGILRWVYLHETLVGALLAFIAAAITVLYLHKQIEENRTRDAQRKLGRLAAEKAVSVHSLSFVISYCRNVFAQTLKMARGDHFEPLLPEIPQQHIDTLKACIEYAAEPERKKLVSMVCELQLLQARFSNEAARYQPEDNISQNAADERAASEFSSVASAVLANLLAEELFGWARDGREDPPPDRELQPRIQRAQNLFDFHKLFRQPQPPALWLDENWPRLSDRMRWIAKDDTSTLK